MDENKIRALLEKYWQGETSLEEEKELKSFFASSQIPDEFIPFQPLFNYFDEAVSVAMESEVQTPVQTPIIRSINLRKIISIAASIAIFAIVFFAQQDDRQAQQTYAYEDSFESPEEAYEQVRSALLYVSSKINQGTETVSMSLDKMQPLSNIIN